MIKNKRGIGPLLATVILVAVAITLGALVSNYMIDKAKEFDPSAIAEESVYCESVTLRYTAYAQETADFDALGGCSNSNSIGPIYLINGGAFSIHKLIITSPGYESLPPRNILTAGSTEPGEIIPGGNYPIMVQINSRLDNNKNIKIIPVIEDKEKDEFVSCVKRQLVIDYTELCADVFPPSEEGP